MNESCNSAMRKPDAGNLHVRFDEGEGTRRSLALRLSFRASLSTLPMILNGIGKRLFGAAELYEAGN